MTSPPAFSPHPADEHDKPVAGCTLVIPCRDEAAALDRLLPQVPIAFDVIVVDNGSTDGTAQRARDHGARVVAEPTPGYGAAVHAGILAAPPGLVAVLDGDDSIDPGDLLALVEAVASGRVDLALGRRVPVARGVWPWHARAGTRLVAWVLARRHRLTLRDLGPVRVCQRDALLALGVADRRSGYPVELLDRAGAAGWRVEEHPVRYRPRAAGTRSKVSGDLRGSLTAAHDFLAVLR